MEVAKPPSLKVDQRLEILLQSGSIPSKERPDVRAQLWFSVEQHVQKSRPPDVDDSLRARSLRSTSDRLIEAAATQGTWRDIRDPTSKVQGRGLSPKARGTRSKRDRGSSRGRGRDERVVDNQDQGVRRSTRVDISCAWSSEERRHSSRGTMGASFGLVQGPFGEEVVVEGSSARSNERFRLSN